MTGPLAIAQGTAQLNAVRAWQHDVKDDEINRSHFKSGPHLISTCHTTGAETAAL